MTTGLKIQGLHAGHHPGCDVIHDINLHAQPGTITALLGPNGAGKSTVLKAILGLVPCRGDIRLNDTPIDTLPPRERAQQIAYVPQRSMLNARMQVEAVVKLGRFSFRGALARWTEADEQAVQESMVTTGVVHLAQRVFTELSGGEQQRVILARALATGATTLLLDEPTSALDVRQMLHLHQMLHKLAHKGWCIIVVLHGLTEAWKHADHAVLIDEGKIFAKGPVADVITADNIRTVYGVELNEGTGLSFSLTENT